MDHNIIKKKLRKVLEKRKGIFFANMSLLVEGLSDERLLKEFYSTLQQTEKSQEKDIEIINMMGATSFEIFNLLTSWKMNVGIIMDHDTQEKYQTFIDDINNENYRSNILLLPSDIEGTIIMGDFLQIIRDIIMEENYTPIQIIEKFGGWREGKKSRKLEFKEINEIISTLEGLRPLDYSSFKTFLSKIMKNDLSKSDFRSNFDENKQLIKEYHNCAIKNIKKYKKFRWYERDKEERAIEMINENDSLCSQPPVIIKSFLLKMLNNNNL